MKTATKVGKANLTYLKKDKLKSLSACLSSVKRNKVPGNFMEFGIALGGSGICIADELDGDRRFLGFDVFGMIPPPGEKDGETPNERYQVIRSGASQGINGDRYYGYIEDLRDQVVRNFRDFGLEVDGHRIELVAGLFEETLPGLPPMAIAFAHIDCDWYDPVMFCLDYIAPRLSPGGFIVVDDYNDWPGCKKATDEFCAKHPEMELKLTKPHAVLALRA